MQGIKVQLNQDSVKRVKEQFSKLLEDLQKSADKNQILVSVSEINKALNNMATQVKNVQSALSSVKSKLKVFDVDEIKKESTEVFKTIDDVKRKYANLGDAVSFSISKDDDGKEIGIIAQIKRNDGVVEKFNHSLINLAKNGQIVEQAFKLDNSVEYEKIEASMNVLSKYESQLNKIKNSYSKADLQDNTHVEQLNKEYSSMLNKIQQLVKSQDVLSNEQKNSIESQITSLNELSDKYINQQQLANQIEEGRIKTLEQRRNVERQIAEEQEKAINKNIELQMKEDELEHQRVTNLGGKIIPKGNSVDLSSSTDQIKQYVRENINAKAVISGMSGELSKNGKAVKEVDVKVKEGKDQWRIYKLTIDEATGAVYKSDKGLKDVMNRQMSFTSAIKLAVERTLQWASAMTLFYGTLRQVKEGIQFINDINSQQTTIKMVTGMNDKEVRDLTKSYAELGEQVGDTTRNLMAGSIEWFRQGKNIKETNQLIQASIMESKLAGIDSAQATTYLTAALNGYGMESTRVMEIVDKMTAIDNAAATSVAELSESLQHSASSASLAGISLDKYLSWVGTVSSVTRKSASSIGESFKSIFARMSDINQGKEFDSDNEFLGNVEQSLSKVGIALRDSNNSFRDFGTVIDDIAKKWSSYNDIQQSDIAKSIAGTRQRENFLSLMQNYGVALDLEQKSLQSAGNAQARYQEYLKSTEAQMAKLKVAGEKFWLSLVNSNVINSAIQLLTGLINLLDELINKNKTMGLTVVALATAFIILEKNIKAMGLTYLQTQFISVIGAIKESIATVGILTTSTQLLKIGFASLATAAKGAMIALAINPLTWIAIAIAGVIALTNHLKNQRIEAENLKKEYEGVRDAIQSVNIESQKSIVGDLNKKQDELNKLIAYRNDLIAKQKSGFGEGDSSLTSKAINDVEKYIQKLRDAGYTIDDATGKIRELGIVQSNVENQSAIDDMEKRNQARTEEINNTENLINSYLRLSETQNRTREQNALMEKIADQLKAKYGELNIAIDANGNLNISNMGVLKDKLVLLQTERDSIQLTAQAELKSAQDRMNIMVGLTNMTVSQARKRLEALKAEMQAHMQIVTMSLDEGGLFDAREGIHISNIQKEIAALNEALSQLKNVSTQSLGGISGSYMPSNTNTTTAKESASQKAQDELQAVQDVEGKIVEIIKKRYEIELDEAEKAHKAKLDMYDKDLKAFQDYINEKIGLLDKEASEEDYTKELKKKQEEALDIRRQIDELLLDSSREAAVKRTDLEKLLAENNEEITTMQTDRERELRKDNLQQQLEDYQKFIEDSKNLEDTSFEQYKADIEAKSSEAQLHLEAKNALMNGVMLDVSGNMVTLTSAFMDFQKRFGDGLGVLANQIQSDFINKLNEAKKVLDSMGNVTVTSNGTPIQGSFDNGGQVDFTGLAMVHGTSSNPEIMLNNSQASKLWNFIQNIPKFIAPKTTQLAGAGANVSMSFDSLINVNGNVDKAVMPSLQDLTNQVCDRLVRQLNMAGIYRR